MAQVPRPKKYPEPKQRDDGRWYARIDSRQVYLTAPRGPGGREAAAADLDARLGRRVAVPSGPTAPVDLPVAASLKVYIDRLAGADAQDAIAAPERQAFAIKRLVAWWGGKTCGEINDTSCQAYMRDRCEARGPFIDEKPVQRSTVRRELNVLRAALGTASKAGILTGVPAVWLPAHGKAKPDWLTRSHFAALLWDLRRHRKTRHAARLAIAQFYSGSRPRTIALSTWVRRVDGPWVDLDGGVW